MLTVIWAWLSALFGLAIIVLVYVDGAIVGVWADEHPAQSATFPNEPVPFVLAGLGVVLLVGGCAVGIHALRDRRR